jgi:hypothetical protein
MHQIGRFAGCSGKSSPLYQMYPLFRSPFVSGMGDAVRSRIQVDFGGFDNIDEGETEHSW